MSDRENAALLALINTRSKGISTAAVISDVWANGGPQEAWAARHQPDLFGSSDNHDLVAAAQQLAAWSRAGLRFVSIVDSAYPQRLRAVHDAPPFLFYRGDLTAHQEGGISVVGSRDASPVGLERAREVSRYLVSEGIPVISGLARGIDSAAHEATLAAGGVPIGVIATGIAAAYTPAGSRELHEAVAGRGLLLSQFRPEAHAMRHTFLERNATMSGLGVATLVIEAGEHSGARAQARLAMEHGRPVILTDSVVKDTKWGQALAENASASVYVVGSMAEAIQAICRVRALTRFDALDRLLLATS